MLFRFPLTITASRPDSFLFGSESNRETKPSALFLWSIAQLLSPVTKGL